MVSSLVLLFSSFTVALGCMFYFFLLFITIHQLPSYASYGDIIILGLFFLSASQCLLCSSLFHTFCAHKKKHYFHKAQIMDYCGISTLICGSFVTYLHYGLHDRLFWRVFYYVLLGIFGVIGFGLPWFPAFQTTSFRTWRTVYYVLMGFSCGAFTIHAAFATGFCKFLAMVGVLNLVMEIGLYLVGALIYVARFPERFFPGKLDILFHGHQIWHMFILMASFFHYRGTLRIMNEVLRQLNNK